MGEKDSSQSARGRVFGTSCRLLPQYPGCVVVAAVKSVGFGCGAAFSCCLLDLCLPGFAKN